MGAILIASSTDDHITCAPVAKRLRSKGHQVIFYKSDLVYSGKSTLTIQPEGGTLKIQYEGMALDDVAIDAAWYRRPNDLGILSSDHAKQRSLEREVYKLQDAVWANISRKKWLNAPSVMRSADNKLHQLAMAQEEGFAIPKTVVSTDWTTIRQTLPHDQIILKMPYGQLWERASFKALYTTILDRDKVQTLQNTRPFPGIFQSYVSKRKEWRITVVGEDVFGAAVYTDPDARDDWRKHVFTEKVRFKAEDPDPSIKRKCVQYLKKLGLRFGAFDFIEDSEGRIIFLELNPNGQFYWLEDELGLPISDSIACLLSDIASEKL